jgi:transmembrane 9 superfamily protein 3
MLSKDYRNIADFDELEHFESGLSEVTGWKQITGEVFRPPASLPMFTGLISTGYQLFAVCAALTATSLLGHMYEERGLLLSWFLVLYCLFAIYGGYVNGTYYAQNKGKRWIRAMLFGCFLFPTLVVGFESVLTFVALVYDSSASYSLTASSKVVALLLFINFPLYVVGTTLGKNLAKDPNFPCKVNPIDNPLLKNKKWYNEPAFLVLVGGLLPFASVSVEAYFIFTSFWNYKFYYVYGFMAAMFLMLIAVLA